MRPLVLGVLLVSAFAAACAPKVVPVVTVAAPRFPEFIVPDVPAELAATAAAQSQDRAWRFLQAGDLRSAERELAVAMRTPAFYPAEAALGYVELARKEPKDALAHFDRALAMRGDYVSALAGRGEALVALGRESEAIAAFEGAVAANSALLDIRRRVEVLKFRALERDLDAARQAARAGRADEAVRLYGSAITASPDSPFLYRELATVEAQRGDGEAALEHFRRAVSLDPSDAASLTQIAALLEARGDLEEALRAYDDAMAIEPNARLEERRTAVREKIELAKLPEEYRAIDQAPSITRADLAAMIAVRLGAALGGPTREGVVVTDVRGNWAEPWIMTAVRAGVMEPFDNHTFQPREIVERADLAQVVTRLLARIAPESRNRQWRDAGVRFPDVPPSHLSYEPASIAVASGVIPRTADGTFEPSRRVTGAEASQAIERLRAMTPLATSLDAPR
jgi:tetratricopeptide (TPR) repeat protein